MHIVWTEYPFSPSIVHCYVVIDIARWFQIIMIASRARTHISLGSPS